MVRLLHFAQFYGLQQLLLSVAPLAWVPWVPGNPSIFKQWIPESSNFEKLNMSFAPFSVQDKQEIGVKALK